MALNFYVDDSGKNDPPVFVLAGFIASESAWANFERGWRACLEAPPAIPYFKMADANRCNGVFRGLSKQERNVKLSGLAQIIADHAYFGLSVAIPHAAFNKVFQGQMMKALDTPYVLAAHLIQAAAHKYLTAQGINDPVHLIFDRQLDREKDITEAHPTMAAGLPPEVQARYPRPPVFADDKTTLPLQASDMLAWHVRRSWKDGVDKLAGLSAAGETIRDIGLINEIWLERDLAHVFAAGQAKLSEMRTLPPHQAESLKSSFEMLATAANIEVMEVAQPFAPIEMVSFPAIGMAKYQLVRSCAEHHSPHLHRKSGNVCLGAQTAAE